ncbi:methyltransferase domain-containing protein [Roseomonas sp. BN140053]|uniref:methyltransferase domain-containing protein n=1 Tax=Roseomonas sp. BN140053 TaxID=3391898 RepID=UPI0039EA0FA3
MHRSSFDKMRAFRDAYLGEHRHAPLSILDVGSTAVAAATESYRPLFEAPPWQYRGLDIAPGPNVDIVPCDPYRWAEIPDASVDVVVSGQAFEHIEWPWLTIREIARVLRGNGLAAIVAPSAGPVHRFPVDCWRYYPDGMPALASFAGLGVVENHWSEGYAYPDCAFWGEAFAVLQRPAAGAASPADCAGNAAPAAASVLAATPSRDATARREAELLAQLRPFALRRQLLAETLRRAWFILRSPVGRLHRF